MGYDVKATAKFLGVLAIAGLVSGCAGNDPGPSMANLLAFNKTTTPAAPEKPQSANLECPDISVLEGTAAHRVMAGATVRYQYALGDVARECAVQGEQIGIKVGVEGKVLLGPAGSAGSFTVPVRIAIIREKDQKPVVSKVYRVAANIPAGQSQAAFTVVSEPLFVPFTKERAIEDYTVKVGFDSGGGGGEKPARRKRGQ